MARATLKKKKKALKWKSIGIGSLFIFAFAFVFALYSGVFRNVAPFGGQLAYHSAETPSADAANFVDDTQTKFDLGTYSSTQWNATSSFVELTAAGLTAKAGNYTSNVKDSGGVSSWDTLTWTPQAPYGKELPNSAASETAYSAGNASMTGSTGLWHLNESAGATSFTDNSGNSQNGSCTVCPTAGGTGKLNTAITFNGSTQFVPIGTAQGFGTKLSRSSHSFSLWVKPNATGARQILLADWNSSGAGASLHVELQSNNTFLYGVAGGGAWADASGSSFTTGTWYFVSGTFDDATNVVTLYINGASVGTASQTSVMDTGNTATMGRAGAYNGLYFNGMLDEVAIWNRALSATEVLDFYKRGALRLKYQVRSCDDSACVGETFVGPNGLVSDYYAEVNNTAITLPSFSITNQISNRYFQYKAFYEMDTASYGPQLKSVTSSYTATAVNISGAVYTDEGSTVMTTTPTVRLKVNGAGSYSAVVATNGTYTIASLSPIPVSGDVLTVYLDGATEKAVTVSRYNSGNPTGLDLYQNRLIIRHEDAGPVTNVNLGQYDKDDDTDLHFTSNAGALAVDNDTKLYVWAGKTFTPGGTVTTSPGATPGGDVFIGAGSTLSVGTNAVSVGGSWDNNGTYTGSSGSTLTLTATSTGKIVEAGTGTYQAVTFNGGSGGWTVQTDNWTVPGNFTLTAASSWTLESGRTLEVDGTFANSAPAATTWTGTTLYLNSGTSYTIGTKTQAAETYGTLRMSPGTNIRLWNSSAGTVTVD